MRHYKRPTSVNNTFQKVASHVQIMCKSHEVCMHYYGKNLLSVMCIIT